jgi:serine carboxypeptidase
LAPYPSKVFFWFFEARTNPSTAPVTVWLNGGPGSASADQALSGFNGPCVVQHDGKTTKLNPNSWTGVSNMLYIDQPTQTGFTYDEAMSGTINMLNRSVDTSGAPVPPELKWATMKGRFSSQKPENSPTTTAVAARAVYHFLNIWFDE